MGALFRVVGYVASRLGLAEESMAWQVRSDWRSMVVIFIMRFDDRGQLMCPPRLLRLAIGVFNLQLSTTNVLFCIVQICTAFAASTWTWAPAFSHFTILYSKWDGGYNVWYHFLPSTSPKTVSWFTANLSCEHNLFAEKSASWSTILEDSIGFQYHFSCCALLSSVAWVVEVTQPIGAAVKWATLPSSYNKLLMQSFLCMNLVT